MGNLNEKFTDFDKANLPNRDGIFIEDNDKIQMSFDMLDYDINFYKEYLKKYNILGKKVYVKSNKTETQVMNELFVSRLFEKLGINTIKAYPIQIKNRSGLEKSMNNNLGVSIMTEDIKNLGMYVGNRNGLFEYMPLGNMSDIRNDRNSGRSGIDYILNNGVRNFCLNTMTKDCYNQLVNYVLATNLLSNCDAHLNNIFFLKENKEDEFFKDICTIDNENIKLLDLLKYDDMFDVNVSNFLKYVRYFSQNLNGISDDLTYEKRLEIIRDLYVREKLGNSQMKLIKDFIKVDIDDILNDIYLKYGLQYEEKELKILHNMQNKIKEYLNDMVLYNYNLNIM